MNEDYIVDARETYNKSMDKDRLTRAPPQSKEEIYNRFFFIEQEDNKENYRELNNIIVGGSLEPGELKFIRKAQQLMGYLEYLQDDYNINLAGSNAFLDRIIKFVVHSSKSKGGFATRSLNKQEVVQQENVRQRRMQQMEGDGDKGFLKGQFKKWLNNRPKNEKKNGLNSENDDNNDDYKGFW